MTLTLHLATNLVQLLAAFILLDAATRLVGNLKHVLAEVGKTFGIERYQISVLLHHARSEQDQRYSAMKQDLEALRRTTSNDSFLNRVMHRDGVTIRLGQLQAHFDRNSPSSPVVVGVMHAPQPPSAISNSDEVSVDLQPVSSQDGSGVPKAHGGVQHPS